MNKIIIIGSGPAGLTAAIYAGRSKFNPIIIDGNQPGGQLTTTTKVENWPSHISIDGPQLMNVMREQAKKCGAEFVSDEVTAVDLEKSPYKVITSAGKRLETETIIIATGTTPKRLGCPGEDEYWGKGVTTCATCDAPFMEGKDVVIVGGGNTSVTEAEHLAKFADKVTIIQNLEKLTATDPIKDKVLLNPKINIFYNSSVVEIKGDGEHSQEVVVEDKQNATIKTLPAYGVFIAIGLRPNTNMFKNKLELNEWGYILLKKQQQTSVSGVFAAGDVCDWYYKQAITSAGDGCKAALDCEVYLTGKLSVTY